MELEVSATTLLEAVRLSNFVVSCSIGMSDTEIAPTASLSIIASISFLISGRNVMQENQ